MEQIDSAIILAGGDSKRMGRDKNLIKLDGALMIEVVTKKAACWFKEVVVVVNNPQKYHFLNIENVRVIQDKIPTNSKCSLRGIYAGLDEINSEYGFVIAGDMPFIQNSLVLAMAEKAATRAWEVVIPKYNHHYEPLFALYHKNCLPNMRAQLLSGNYKIIDLLDRIKTLELSSEFCKQYDPQLWSFFNINTPEQLEIARRFFQK